MRWESSTSFRGNKKARRSGLHLDMVLNNDTISPMNSAHKKTLDKIAAKPERGDVKWSDVEKLLLALGCREIKGDGSRVRFVAPQGTVLLMHRPHPRPDMDKGAVKSLRNFLKEIKAL